jgi:hypothetical protein
MPPSAMAQRGSARCRFGRSQGTRLERQVRQAASEVGRRWTPIVDYFQSSPLSGSLEARLSARPIYNAGTGMFKKQRDSEPATRNCCGLVESLLDLCARASCMVFLRRVCHGNNC